MTYNLKKHIRVKAF